MTSNIASGTLSEILWHVDG